MGDQHPSTDEPPTPVVPDEGGITGWGCVVVIVLCLIFLSLLVVVGSIF